MLPHCTTGARVLSLQQIRASLASSGYSDGRGETISVRADSSGAVCGGRRPLHHDSGAAARLRHAVCSGRHHGVCWDCVEPLPVLSQGRYRPCVCVLGRPTREIICD